ncbi:MAG: CopG family transcriptional regulator [candidate division FCPU426 bacterium]
MRAPKQEIVTFKLDRQLHQDLCRIPNKSEFIRSAIQTALSGTCPLCQGSGKLTTHQRRQWRAFTRQHAVRTCKSCQALHVRPD